MSSLWCAPTAKGGVERRKGEKETELVNDPCFAVCASASAEGKGN